MQKLYFTFLAIQVASSVIQASHFFVTRYIYAASKL